MIPVTMGTKKGGGAEMREEREEREREKDMGREQGEGIRS